MTKRLSALLCHTLDYVSAGLRRLAAQGHKFLPSRRITLRLRLLHAVVAADDNPLRRITFERDNLSPTNEILPTERLHCRRYLRRELVKRRLVEDFNLCDRIGERLGLSVEALNSCATEYL